MGQINRRILPTIDKTNFVGKSLEDIAESLVTSAEMGKITIGEIDELAC